MKKLFNKYNIPQDVQLHIYSYVDDFKFNTEVLLNVLVDGAGKGIHPAPWPPADNKCNRLIWKPRRCRGREPDDREAGKGGAHSNKKTSSCHLTI